MTPELYTESRDATRTHRRCQMPNEDKTRAALPAQIEGAFNITVEANAFGECMESEFQAGTIELFPQTETIHINSSVDDEGFGIELAPRDALDLAKKLMAMCAAYTEDIGACDPCGELYPMEELNDLESTAGDMTACNRCMESGSL